MKKADKIKTPRFLTVTISRMFKNSQNAHKAGFVEPTHYRDDQGFQVFGKVTSHNHMIFAGVRPE